MAVDPTIQPWPKGTYLKNASSSLCFDPAVHDGAALLKDGWASYDPLAPGGDLCTDSHAWILAATCPHNETWHCERAPREFWFPLAAEPRFRDANYFYAHRDEVEAYDKAHPSTGPSPEDNARMERFKAARQGGATWVAIFAKEDGPADGR